jgi:hypothetical protein
MRLPGKIEWSVLAIMGVLSFSGCSIESDPRATPVNQHYLLTAKTQIRLKNGETWCLSSFKRCTCNITIIAADGQKTELTRKYCRYRDIKHPTHFGFGFVCREMANPDDPNLLINAGACSLSAEEDFSSYDCQSPGVSRANARSKFIFGSRSEFSRDTKSSITSDDDFDISLTPILNERETPIGSEFKYLKDDEECGAVQ